MTDLSTLTDDQLRALYSSALPGSAPLSSLSDEQIQALHAQLPPGNPPVSRQADVATGNLGTDVPRFLGTAAANVAAGATALPRTIAQGVDWVGSKFGYNPGAEAALASVKSPTDPRYSMFPDYQTARNVFLGGTGATEFVPRGWVQRRGMDAVTGTIGGLLAGPQAVVPSALGSATAGQAAEAFPDHPLIAAMLGFVPGAWAGKQLMNAPQRVGATMMNTAPTEPYAAFQRQGLPTELVGTTTGNGTWAEKFAARMPGSEGAITDARSRLVNAWQQRFNDVADSLGSAKTPTDLGVSLQGAARNWLQDFKSGTTQLWNQFRAMVPADQPTEVSSFKKALDDTLGQFEGAPKTAQVLQPGLAARLKTAVEADTSAPKAPTARASGVLDANGQPIVVQPTATELAQYQAELAKSGKLPWQAVQSIRSRLGEMIENPDTAPDMSQTAIRRLYGALTDDMKSGAASTSQEALSAFHRANAATAAGHDLLETHLDGILNAPSPERAAQYAMSEGRLGGTRLGAITFNLPAAAGDVSSFALRNAATNTESPSALATALMGRKPIYSPETMNVLFPNASTRADIADLATVGQRMQPFEKDLANSPTATHEARGVGRLVTALEMAKEGHDLAGNVGRAAGFALGFGAPNIGGRMTQAVALNPWLSALYGRDIPMEAQTPSLLAKALMAPALQGPQVPRIAAPDLSGVPLLAPATSPSLGR